MKPRLKSQKPPGLDVDYLIPIMAASIGVATRVAATAIQAEAQRGNQSWSEKPIKASKMMTFISMRFAFIREVNFLCK